MRGLNRTTAQPLNSIDPWQLVAGVDHRTAAWELRPDLRRHTVKKVQDIDSPALVKAPNTQITVLAATTLDLSGQWRIRKDLRLTASIINLTKPQVRAVVGRAGAGGGDAGGGCLHSARRHLRTVAGRGVLSPPPVASAGGRPTLSSAS